eukprot:3990479-Prymnesium_polylepis.1
MLEWDHHVREGGHSREEGEAPSEEQRARAPAILRRGHHVGSSGCAHQRAGLSRLAGRWRRRRR